MIAENKGTTATFLTGNRSARHLSEQFEGAEVHVGSAHMRILGGIAVTDLKITRPGPDGGEVPLIVVPSAVLYHDKEQLNRGRLVISKEIILMAPPAANSDQLVDFNSLSNTPHSAFLKNKNRSPAASPKLI